MAVGVPPTLVGRDEELAALVAAVLGPPVVVSIEGEAGVGKTWLPAPDPLDDRVCGRRRS